MTALCILNHETPRNAAVGHLCAMHHAHLEQTLAEMPALIVEVSRHVQRESQRGQRVSGTREKPLPINEQASDAWRLARDVLASWSKLVSEELGVTQPWPMIDETSRFLLRHVEQISAADWIDDLVSEVTDARKALRAVLSPVRTKRVPLGPCAVIVACDVLTAVEVVCPGVLRAIVSLTDEDQAAVIVCTDCGATYQPHEWRPIARRLRKDAEGDWVTMAQVSGTLGVPVRTLNNWRVADGWRVIEGPKVAHRPGRLVSFDDAHASYQARRQEQAG